MVQNKLLVTILPCSVCSVTKKLQDADANFVSATSLVKTLNQPKQTLQALKLL